MGTLRSAARTHLPPPAPYSIYDTSPAAYKKFAQAFSQSGLPSTSTLKRLDKPGLDDDLLGPPIPLGDLLRARAAADARGIKRLYVALGNDDVMLRQTLRMFREKLAGFPAGAASWDVADTAKAADSDSDSDGDPEMKRVRKSRATHMSQWLISSLDETLHFPVASILVHESDKARAAKQVG
jgi:hypothetical protein